MALTVAFVAEGDANTADCWSGSGRSFVEALRDAGVRVDVYDAELRSWPRAVAALLTYHPARGRWRQRYWLGRVPFRARSRGISRALTASRVTYDAVIQVGATFEVSDAARHGAPYVIYCDSNLARARRGAPYSGASRLDRRELEDGLRRERRVYDAADRIWSWSESLAHSFREDFAQPAAKIATIYGGPNNVPSPVRSLGGAPSILFIGKDHERKGSAVLLRAFELVREAVPNAALHLVGGVPPDSKRPGVVAHGVLSRATPEGRRLLDELFGNASVFCMPSRYEPFGVAFVEAMLAGLACVGTRRWAMPEIIDDGKTGWLVPDGSVDTLARVLIAALRDPSACARMGAAGRERSLAHFTWEHAASRAIADLQQLGEFGAAARRRAMTA
jgi:alpha-maltose-1-phosphate synthase